MTLPAVGVQVKKVGVDGLGVVRGHENTGTIMRIKVEWRPAHNVTSESPQVLRTALSPGMDVIHQPAVVTRASLGHGRVEQIRAVAGREQVLVDFWESGKRVWLPWQHLVAIPGVRRSFEGRQLAKSGHAEAFRLRNLAYALEQWHSNTGALSRLEIDPLPHQIHLVHRILTSGNLNWLIADDVGLGKTIEVGLLLKALVQRGMRRVLLVVPAGLTRQWKEEMRDKFDMRDFMIYGSDFSVDDPVQWKLFDRVIISVDRAKRDEHLPMLLQADRWDLVVFDEAHWLSRQEYGLKVDSSDRYRLARALREQTDSVLLLSGTPHQGKDDKFRALLELLRPGPDWRQRFFKLQTEPEMLRDLVIRNRKADVTDIDGNFIFKGKDTHTLRIDLTPVERDFDDALQRYLREGYAASARAGTKGLAIGFVMTTYRKLAASSLAAIAGALRRRQQRLLSGEASDERHDEEADARFVEHDEQVTGDAQEFFSGELAMLDALAESAEALCQRDSKVEFLLQQLVRGVLDNNRREKILIFSEYRTTQDHLVRSLRDRYGEDAVSLIRGGQTYEERRAAIDHFEEIGQFLVSTEAGGEGLNLQRNCHIMVNFDLPWNPMRLVQRVGRLYRYGQEKRVVVFNVHVPDSLDSDILQTMYERLEVVAREMAGVGDEYREGLKEDILGELIGNLDVHEILESAATSSVEHSQQRLEAALARAREATRQQDKILSFASGYDPNELRHELKLDERHLRSFAEGMCARTGVEIAQRTYAGAVWDVKLPEALQFSLRLNQNYRITFERRLARRAKGAALFGPENPLYERFVRLAKDHRAGGHTAALKGVAGSCGLGAMLRWMDDQGHPLYREYVGISVGDDGAVSVNDDSWGEMLSSPQADAALKPPPSRELWTKLEEQLQREMARRLEGNVQPDQAYHVGAVWFGE